MYKNRTIFLSSPGSQVQAEAAVSRPVLVSYALWQPWMRRYTQAWGAILVDSGAYTEFTKGIRVDVEEYVRWARSWGDRIEAFAGVDDIGGDWRRSLSNYKLGGFPTYHFTDPWGLLDDLVPLAEAAGGWIGVGMDPTDRYGHEAWVRETLERIPPSLHVHGWAMRIYKKLWRFDSFDSTNWFRDAMKVRKAHPWLTYGESLEIVVKRYDREGMEFDEREDKQVDLPLVGRG